MAHRIKELRQQHADLTQQARTLVDTATAADRDLTAGETAARDKIFARMDRVSGDIRLEEAAMDRERAEGPQPSHMQSTPGSSVAFGGAARRPSAAGLSLAGGSSPQAIVGAVFGHAHDLGGFEGLGDYLTTLVSGRHDPRLQAAGQVGNDGPLGGYAVPTQIAADILRAAVEQSIVLPRAQFRVMTSRTGQYPAWSTALDGATGSHFGLKREWLDEAEAATPQTARLETIELHARTSAIVVKLSGELIADAVGFEGQIRDVIASAIGHFLDVDCLTGTGAGQPLGAMNAPATITVAKESGQAADTLVYANVLNMWSRLAPSSAASAIWLASPSCLPQLATMSVTVGTGGSTVNALAESNGRYTLLGRELILTHKAKPIGDLGDVSLVDLGQYLLGVRAGLAFQRSEHLGFLSGEIYLRAAMRFDGQPVWKAPYSAGSAHPTVSPFIVLAARP